MENAGQGALQNVVTDDRPRAAGELPNALQSEPNVSELLADMQVWGLPEWSSLADCSPYAELLVDTQGPKEETKRAKQDASLEETRFKLIMFQPHVAVDVLHQRGLASTGWYHCLTVLIPSGNIWQSWPSKGMIYDGFIYLLNPCGFSCAVLS